jgi:bifunctional non-homologous end joining protein LigD
VNDVLFSWALPKGMPEEYGVKRLAIRTPDHAMAWAKFQGTIPEGQYGAGTVKIWDKGFYLPIKLSKGRMKFRIEGKRLKGVWRLTEMSGPGEKWLIERIEEEGKE